jgi:hypothetical protein
MAFSMKHNSPLLQGTTEKPKTESNSFLDRAQNFFNETLSEAQKFIKRPFTEEQIRNKPTKGTRKVYVENADVTRLDNSQLNQATDSAMAYIKRGKNFSITPGNKFKSETYKGVTPVTANTFPASTGSNNAITREQIKEKFRTTGNAALSNGQFVEGVKPFFTANINPQREAMYENNKFIKDSTAAAKRHQIASERLNKYLAAKKKQ